MAVKKSRCFSGPPTHLGYCAVDLETAKKLFFWYSLGRTLLEQPYPMWIDAEGMWAPSIPRAFGKYTFQAAFAIAYAENECIDAHFTGNNPKRGLPHLFVPNPMTPLNPESFWSQTLKPYVADCTSSNVRNLVAAVDGVFQIWNVFFALATELPVAYKRPYFVGEGTLTRTAGLVQIRDYASENGVSSLVDQLRQVREHLSVAKRDFFEWVNVKLNYFGSAMPQSDELAIPAKSRFDKALCRRLALAGLLVRHLHDDPNFGRTKLAKLFYIADAHEQLDLETKYYREAAGPLDQRALYNERIGIEALGDKHCLFSCEQQGRMVRYKPSSDLERVLPFAATHLGGKTKKIIELALAFRELTTDQSEIVATLYACWNDFLLQKSNPTDDEIVSEFLLNWHAKKKRFSRKRLVKALGWMRERGLVPHGTGKRTSVNMAA